MKYYIHKIENGRGRCVLEIEAETVNGAWAFCESRFDTGRYYVISSDGYTGGEFRITGEKPHRKTIDRYTVKIKRLGRWFTVYDGFNPDTARRKYDTFKYFWIYRETRADDVKITKKRIPRQPWHR